MSASHLSPQFREQVRGISRIALLLFVYAPIGCARPTEEPAAQPPPQPQAIGKLQAAEKPANKNEPPTETKNVAEDKTGPVGAVTQDHLLHAADNNANWLMYGRTYDAHRYSPLKQIDKKNVARLIPQWTFQTGVLDGFESTPLVIDGIMYLTTPWNHAYAIDCKTGSQLWHYQKSLPENMALCCDAVNRGFAAWGERLYMTTLDAHLVCLDRNTGEEVWDTAITVTGDDGKEIKDIYKMAYSATVAPLVVKDKVIMGISGAEYGIRGFLDAYDAKSGKRLWRFYTVPSPNDKAEHAKKALASWQGKSWLTGGGSAWVTGTYDPKLNTLYWGIGNPSPDFNGDVRKGDNLYTCSILALNPDDGSYKWHFQNSPHDVWDYDGVNEPLLVDVEKDGKPVKALVQAHRNGYFYCLNRETGKFLYGKPFCEVNWTDRKKGVDGLDPDTGRPFVNPAALPTEKGVRVCPGAAGGKEWNPMAYHPGTGLAYVPVINNCAKFTSGKAFFIKGQPYWGSSLTLIDNQASGSLKAIDVKTGKIKWDVATRSPMVAGVLATGGGLVFTGDAEGFFTAYDADTGKTLWSFQCGSGHHAPPITYTLDGRQYIAVCVGWGGWTAGFAGDGAPWLRNARRGNTLFVFALPPSQDKETRRQGDKEKRIMDAQSTVTSVTTRRQGGGIAPATLSFCLLVSLSPCLLVCEGRAAEEKPLIFCAVPASMPRIGKTPDGQPEGLDATLAQRLGRRLGRKIEFHWCGSAACSRKCLREGRCDVILGQPHEAGPPGDLAWSVPYAGSQFGLVVPREAVGVRSLNDLVGKRVGVAAGTVALSEKNHTVVSFKTREELLTGFRSAALDAAFLDADFAAWYLHARPKLGLRLVKEYVPRERWNMALIVRTKDAALLVRLNRALAQLAESGALRDIHADYGVPFRPPFTDSARRTARVNTWQRIRDRGEVVAAMDPANLPYSSAKGDRPGFDVEIARALAKEMGVKLRIEWLDVQRETAIGKLAQRECDLALGAAVDPNAVEDDEELAGKVIYSRPYYGSGYLLVQRKKGPHIRSLADIKGEKSRRLGAEAGSIADYQLRQRGYLRRLYRNQLAVLKSLNDGDIDYAYLWANAGWTLHTSPDFALEITVDYVPEDHWNIAVALRQGDDELKQHVDAAIEKLVKDGTVSRALARYHVPYFPAFAEEKTGEAGVIHHKKLDRGLEPQLARVQRSKHSYGGLERVRSAGVLVVGLDQNNLPFSTAHPKAAGLDYEIAGLLAEQMGLSLRVYWAYSAHDSYPSKLATKKQCDVILGVIPDDRFAKRVLYSKPYHIAGYQLVVRAGDDAPAGLEQLGDEPLAVEQGIAVRGLEGRKTRSYPSLKAVLQAVKDKHAKAGYVISTRGPWLAAERWPKELKFIPLADSMDRFPLCVAVRKSDGDLKNEIDRALAELKRSGRLSKVFARWHVPYAPANE